MVVKIMRCRSHKDTLRVPNAMDWVHYLLALAVLITNYYASSIVASKCQWSSSKRSMTTWANHKFIVTADAGIVRVTVVGSRR